jgi:hypothetical protein
VPSEARDERLVHLARGDRVGEMGVAAAGVRRERSGEGLDLTEDDLTLGSLQGQRREEGGGFR